MTTATTTNLAANERAGLIDRVRELRRVYGQLMKLRLSTLVVLTAMVGFVLGSAGAIDWLRFVVGSLGVLLAAGSANALNQVLERHRDAKMRRTMGRPLPSGRVGVLHATVFAIAIGAAGVVLMAEYVNNLAAWLTLANILLYVLVYTPMKTRSTLNTLVGAVVGAIPPVIGWTAATGRVDAGAWVLAAILFVWQMPHFLALAWMYRDDYAKGGYRMLPSVDPTGRLTATASLMYCLALLPVGLTATLVGVTGWVYLVGSLALGGWMTYLGWKLLRQRDRAAARKLFLASVLYLPLLMGLQVFDRSDNWLNHAAQLTATTQLTETSAGPTAYDQP